MINTCQATTQSTRMIMMEAILMMMAAKRSTNFTAVTTLQIILAMLSR